MRLLGARLISPAALLLSLRRHLQAAALGARRHLQPVPGVSGPLLRGPPASPLPQLREGREPGSGRGLPPCRLRWGFLPADACGAARRGKRSPVGSGAAPGQPRLAPPQPLSGWWGPRGEGCVDWRMQEQASAHGCCPWARWVPLPRVVLQRAGAGFPLGAPHSWLSFFPWQIFCSRCSQHTAPLPHYGLLKPVRVCTHCYTLHLPARPPTPSRP